MENIQLLDMQDVSKNVSLYYRKNDAPAPFNEQEDSWYIPC
jgi:hypothetical protein